MNIKIDLDGRQFDITDEGYELLRRAVKESTEHLSGEIRSSVEFDIEQRLANYFAEKSAENPLITTDIVRSAIEAIGLAAKEPEPEDVDIEKPSTDEGIEQQSEAANRGQEKKSLYRDVDSNVLGGVCGGIGHWIGVDCTWIRLTFIVLLFPLLQLWIIPAYVILWIAVPAALTKTQRMKMLGEKIAEHVSDTEDARTSVRSSNRGCLVAIWAVVVVILFITLLIMAMVLVVGTGMHLMSWLAGI